MKKGTGGNDSLFRRLLVGGVLVILAATVGAPVRVRSDPSSQVQPSARELRQWAISATASSEYTSSSWSATQATRAPDTSSCGDIPTAWAPESGGGGPEWIELAFETPVHATLIRVHETNQGGAIFQIDLRDTVGNLQTVWTGKDTTPCPGWLEISIPKAPFLVSGVRLKTKRRGYEEIDAVELIGELSPEQVAALEAAEHAREEPQAARGREQESEAVAATEAEERAGEAAEQDGNLREALRHYMAALQALPASPRSEAEARFRERIIRLVLSLDPPPAVPEEARRRLARGNATVKLAGNPEELKDAISEYQQALLLAPWWPQAYYSLAVAQDLAGNYPDAIRNLQFYLLASPNASNADDVKNLMVELEIKQEKAERQRAALEAQAEADRRKAEQARAMIQGLSGNWTCEENCQWAQISISGSSFTARIGVPQPEGAGAVDEDKNQIDNVWVFSGRLDDLVIEGTVVTPRILHGRTTCVAPSSVRPFTGLISEDGRSIELRTETNIYHYRARDEDILFVTVTSCVDVTVDHTEPDRTVLAR